MKIFKFLQIFGVLHVVSEYKVQTLGLNVAQLASINSRFKNMHMDYYFSFEILFPENFSELNCRYGKIGGICK